MFPSSPARFQRPGKCVAVGVFFAGHHSRSKCSAWSFAFRSWLRSLNLGVQQAQAFVLFVPCALVAQPAVDPFGGKRTMVWCHPAYFRSTHKETSEGQAFSSSFIAVPWWSASTFNVRRLPVHPSSGSSGQCIQ